MVVEDDEGVRELVRADARGQRLRGADRRATPTRPRGCARARGVDLLLTDVVMPDVSGRELAERLGALAPDMRILFMSGYSDEAVVRHGELSDAAAFLEKPFTEKALARKVREVLDQPQRGCTASIALLHVGEVGRARRQELVGLVVGHRAVGEEGEERRAGVGDAGRARLGLRDRRA